MNLIRQTIRDCLYSHCLWLWAFVLRKNGWYTSSSFSASTVVWMISSAPTSHRLTSQAVTGFYCLSLFQFQQFKCWIFPNHPSFLYGAIVKASFCTPDHRFPIVFYLRIDVLSTTVTTSHPLACLRYLLNQRSTQRISLTYCNCSFTQSSSCMVTILSTDELQLHTTVARQPLLLFVNNPHLCVLSLKTSKCPPKP